MEMPDQTERLWGLNEDIVVHEGSDGSKIVVTKGEKTEKYSEFDIQIQLKGRNYRSNYTPAHPEVFRDLDAKIESNSETASRLYEIMDQVFRGDDPDDYADELVSMSFEDEKFPADVTVYLFQQMLIEQEINYGPGGNWTRYHPPRDLLMSCVRWIFSGEYTDIIAVINAGYKGMVDEKYRFNGDDIWMRPKL